MNNQNKIILHCDLNNFFASVECLDHPELDGLPVAVCGSIEDRHGIILAKNEAAKKYGIKTAEVVWQAQMKCKDLILLPPNMDKYIHFSKMARDIYAQYTDLIEPFGIDECWLDVTGSTMLFGSGEEIANKIREHIKRELKLTISVGVSFNKIFAKLGSDIKKPDAVTCIRRENFKDIVWGLNSSELLGVGKATCAQLKKYGINTIGDIARSEQEFITQILGKNGTGLWEFANGKGGAVINHQSDVDIIKSVGNSTTCKNDLVNSDEVWHVIYALAESVAGRLRKHQQLAGGIQISVKDNTLSVKEFQAPLPFYTRYPKDLADEGLRLFKKNYHFGNNVRAVGIKAINLIADNQSVQYSMLYDQQKINEHESLEDKIALLRERYGENSISRASLMIKNKASAKIEQDYTSLPGKMK